MKKTILITSLSCLVSATVILCTGCLKDKLADEGKAGFQINNDEKIAEIAGGNEITIALEASASDTTFNLVKVRIATDKPVTADTKVKLAINQSLVDAYNTAHGTSYVIPAAALYRFDNLTVTIPAGSREGHLKMTVKSADLIGTEYAFGFSILSSEDPSVKISGNFKNQFIIIGVKNEFDGIYKVRGSGTHPNPALTGSFIYEDCDFITLVTAGANSVDMQPGQPTANGSSVSFFGAVLPRLTVDPGTRAITVSGAPNNGVVFDPQPGYNSRYDPATRTFYVKLGWSGTRIYTDTLTYCGPR